MPPQVEEKSMIPTVLVGIGGTGAEVLARVRRLVEETYRDLDKFPIISFLLIDTDRDYKVTNPEASGTSFKDYEKHWARVTGKNVESIISNIQNYPWINNWFPSELERNINSLEAGAGQIRPCGRFAFFFNYSEIREKFLSAIARIKGHETYMQDNYGIKVAGNGINVFVTGSLSGGTGSGMLIDMGYCLRHWLKSESSALLTAIVPTPEAFKTIKVGDRVLANGYAAMMELSYFSDERTEYVAQFSSSLSDEIRSSKPPFDFTYLVGTKNSNGDDFNLGQIREMIAQNIFLDMTSDFAAHKRSIRDNIKGAWAEKDPGGRGYSKQFMSFGLSSVEIPIAHIRTCLGYRLGKDFINWWLNDQAILPPEMLQLVRNEHLKPVRLNDNELVADLSAASDRSYIQVISEWVNSIRDEINREDLLQCSAQGVNMMGRETGKILQLINYLKPKVEEYRAEHFRELSPEERLHGDYLKKIYSNRDNAIIQGKKALEEQVYAILQDRTRGPKYADAFFVTVRQIFADTVEKFRREQDQIFAINEINRLDDYEKAIAEINEFKDKFGISKKDKMEQYCNQALQGLEGNFIAIMQRKTRAAGLQVIEKLLEHLDQLETKFKRWQQKLIIMRDIFDQQSNSQADSADALVINGIKLYDRAELNELYDDFLEKLAGSTSGTKSLREIGLDSVCNTMSGEVLPQLSPIWQENRPSNQIMRLFDFASIPDIKDEDVQEIIFNQAKTRIETAPENSRLKTDLAACDRLLKIYNDDAVIRNNLRIAYNQSNPLISLSKSIMQGQDAGFVPAINQNVALVGGGNTTDIGAQKILAKLAEFVSNKDDIKPLGELERHRIVFVQEIGGFSLRCIEGMKELRQSYLDWKGQYIIAKRAQQEGKSRDLPIPVHMEKNPVFWDIFPEDDYIFKLVVLTRALKILRQDVNQKTKEPMIRYSKQTVIGSQNVDLASTWQEVIAVLEVKSCREDREEIERQLNQKFHDCETDSEKQALYLELLAYLEQRATDLIKQGGKDSPEYKREAQIIQDEILARKLNTGATIPTTIPVVQPEPIPVTTNGVQTPPTRTHVFCTKCGQQNPIEANFCSKCGNKLK